MVQQTSSTTGHAQPVLAEPTRDRPIVLPHLEWRADGPLFAGEPVDPALAGNSDRALLDRCDGEMSLAECSEQERQRVFRWHAAGLLVFAPAERKAPSSVVVSPHPDDAVLAVGGLLAARGGLVLDAFSVETRTHRPYYAQRPRLATRMLLAEEDLACRVIGAQPRYLGFLDAADRPHWADRFLLTCPASATSIEREAPLLAELSDALERNLPDSGPVYVPLGVGGHVDHVLCREAVLRLVCDDALPPSRLAFYEDQPYSLFSDAAELATDLSERLSWPALRPRHVDLRTTESAAKEEALRCYRLQVPDGIVKRIARYARKRAAGRPGKAAERVWTLGTG